MKKRLKVILIGLGVILGAFQLHAQVIDTRLNFVSNTGGTLIFDVQLKASTGTHSVTWHEHSVTMAGRLDEAWSSQTFTNLAGWGIPSAGKSGDVLQWQYSDFGGISIGSGSWTGSHRITINYTMESSLGSITWGGGYSYIILTSGATATAGSIIGVPSALTDFPLPVQVTQMAAEFASEEGVVNVGFHSRSTCSEYRIYRSLEDKNYQLAGKIPGGFQGNLNFEDKVENAGFYYYKIEVVNSDGSISEFGPVTVQVEIIPESFKLYGNFPNPFNPSTTIRYDLPENSNVQLKIYNILGNEIITLVNEEQKAGEQFESWDGTDQNGNLVGSGVYFYKLVVGTEIHVGKMLKVE